MTTETPLAFCVQCGQQKVVIPTHELCRDCEAYVAAKNVIILDPHDERALIEHMANDHLNPIGTRAFPRDIHRIDHDERTFAHSHGHIQPSAPVAADPHKIYDITGREAEVGQHICLVEMPNDPSPVPVGATAMITNVVGGPLPQLWVEWEEPYADRTLCLTTGDRYVVLVD